METKTYSEKLKDPRWQKKRLKILERDKFQCKNCESTEKTLHVHHKIYLKNIEPWDYDNFLLLTLCEDCHKLFSTNKEDAKEILLFALYHAFPQLSDKGLFFLFAYKTKFQNSIYLNQKISPIASARFKKIFFKYFTNG